MIRNEKEYQEAALRLKAEKKLIAEQEKRLKEMKLSSEEVRRAVEPMLSFHLQLSEEVDGYERLKRGDLGEFKNLHGIGAALVALRIARGLSQRELAEKLDIHESQVSRDERNDYHGITLERTSRILDALGADLLSQFKSSFAEGPDKDRKRKKAVGEM